MLRLGLRLVLLHEVGGWKEEEVEGMMWSMLIVGMRKGKRERGSDKALGLCSVACSAGGHALKSYVTAE